MNKKDLKTIANLIKVKFAGDVKRIEVYHYAFGFTQQRYD